MSTIILKYSDLFYNDGGIEQVVKDLEAGQEKIVQIAKDIKANFNKNFDLSDNDAINEFEKQTEDLTENLSSIQKAQKKVNDMQKTWNKTIKTSNSTTEEQINNLAKLDRELEIYRSQLKEINKLSKSGKDTERDLNKERAEAQLNIKRVRAEIRQEEKAIINSNKAKKEELKLAEALDTINNKEITTRADLRRAIAAYNVLIDNTNIATQEGIDTVKGYTAAQDELRERLSEVSDTFTQNKINIGNYEESIVNALNSTNAFSTGISGLDSSIGSLISLLTLTKEELADMEKNLGNNTNALQRFAISFGKLNKALKASIIGVVIVAVAALASAFGDTRAGAVRLEKVLSSLQSGLTAFLEISKELFISLFKSITNLSDTISFFFLNLKKGLLESTNLFGRNNEEIKKIQENLIKIAERQKERNESDKENGSLIERLKKIWNSAGKSITRNLENIEKAFNIEDNIRRLTLEIEDLNGELALLQNQADDSTQSLTNQLKANSRALEVSEEIARRNVEIARQRLELANERVKANASLRPIENQGLNQAKKGVEFAKETLRFAQQQGASLEISNSLLEEQQSALVEITKAENEQQLIRAENARQRREIERDLFEQNLDLLIDLIDTEKNLSEQFVNDTTRNFEARINEFNRFLVRFRSNAQRELDEFTAQAQRRGLDLDFDIQFNEDGSFELFIGDQQLAIDNIVELNKQLQATGLSEIEINRFREFIIETRNGVKDFTMLNKELVLASINFNQLRAEFSASKEEIRRLDELDKKIKQIRESLQGTLTVSQRNKAIKQLEQLEEERSKISEDADKERVQARINSINQELKTVDKGSTREIELLQEKIDLEKQLRDEAAQEEIKSEINKQKKIIAEQKKAAAEIRRIISMIANEFVKQAANQTAEAEKASQKQEEAVSRQQQRAVAGLENTLAQEQKLLGEREAERVRAEQRQRRLEKIRALYSSYANYANQGDGENAIGKALRDFAILQAVEATFADGGIVGIDGLTNKVKTDKNGITVGRSHSMKGGILALHEGGEGFFSRKEVANMGEDNFRLIKSMAAKGPIGTDFFSNQRKAFVATVPTVNSTDQRLLSEVKELKRAVQNQSSESWDVEKIFDDVFKLTKTTTKGNSKKRKSYIKRKPRF